MCCFRILLALAVAVSLAVPQEPEKNLTNADVAAMLKAGLAESTISRAIELAALRGTTRFETSAAALIALKNQGATARILDAMLDAGARPKRVLPSTAIPGLPAEQGVYYRSGDRWIPLSSSLVWPEINTRWRGVTALEDRRYVLAGAHAGLRVSEQRPSFNVRGIEPRRVWQWIRLTGKGDHREWRTAPADVFRFARSMEAQPGSAPGNEVRQVAHDVFELRPVTDLEPGEYALTMLVPGQRWLVVAYEFAVAAGPTR
jgi:hypothetical protein